MTDLINDHWHPFFDNLDIGVALVAKDGDFLKVNPFLCEIVEYTESEILKRTFQEITHPSDLQADLEMVKKIILGEIPGYRMTKRYITKTNKVVWVELIVLSISDINYEMFFVQLLPLELSKDSHIDPIPKIGKIDFLSILKKNWKLIWGIGLFTITTIIGIGIAFWTGINQLGLLNSQVYSLSEDVRGNRQTIMKIVDDEISKQKRLVEEIKDNPSEE